MLLFVLPKCAIICNILAFGGKAMKRVISLALVALMCAVVFVGCGGSQSVSSQNSVISKYLPHNEQLTWDSAKSSVLNAYETDISIGLIIWDRPDYDFDSSDKIRKITYKKRNITSNYYHFIVKELNKLYGENEETENTATWKVKLPTGEDCLISLSNNTDEKKEVVLSYDIQRKTNTQTSSTMSSNETSEEKLPTIPNSGGVWLAKPKELAEEWEKRLPNGYRIKIPDQSPDDSSKYISIIDSETAIVFGVDSSKCVNNVYIQYKKENGILTENDKNRVEEYVSALMQTVNPESTSNRLSEIKEDMLMTDDNTFGTIIRDNIMFRFKQQSDNWIAWILELVD